LNNNDVNVLVVGYSWQVGGFKSSS